MKTSDEINAELVKRGYREYSGRGSLHTYTTLFQKELKPGYYLNIEFYIFVDNNFSYQMEFYFQTSPPIGARKVTWYSIDPQNLLNLLPPLECEVQALIVFFENILSAYKAKGIEKTMTEQTKGLEHEKEDAEKMTALGFKAYKNHKSMVCFEKGGLHIWEIRDGWQTAYLYKGTYTDHKPYPTLDEAIEGRKIKDGTQQ